MLASEERTYQVYFDTLNLSSGRYTNEIRVLHDGDNPDLVIGFSADLLEPAVDKDSDGLPDGEDNCPETSNQNQTDTDGDGLGDVCDPDDDGDGIDDSEDDDYRKILKV